MKTLQFVLVLWGDQMTFDFDPPLYDPTVPYNFVSAVVIGGEASGRIIIICPSVRFVRLNTSKIAPITEYNGDCIKTRDYRTYALKMVYVDKSIFHFLIPEGVNSDYLMQELTRSYINQCGGPK
jgi:hypothetical protein